MVLSLGLELTSRSSLTKIDQVIKIIAPIKAEKITKTVENSGCIISFPTVCATAVITGPATAAIPTA